MRRVLTVALLLLVCVSLCGAKRVIKVLAIGNSFSEDAVEQYLYELAATQGDSLVIGNAYIGGCSIDRHWKNAQTGKAEYRYRKIVGGHTTTISHSCLDNIVKDEPWDIISLQQASHYSGLPYTYANLGRLKAYVLATATNKNVEIVWHMTWAYAKDSRHKGFRYYRNDQQRMYQCIALTARQEPKAAGIGRIIPSGAAIHHARAAMGDVLCRDGFHLNLLYGRYTAACVWCEFLTGKRVVGNSYCPSGVSPSEAQTAQRSAHKACREFR